MATTRAIRLSENSDGGVGVGLASVAECNAAVITTKAVPPIGLPLRVEGDALVRQDGYGGNARGDGAVDLQRERSADTQVANGPKSVICGGEDNTAFAAHSAVGGGEGNLSTHYHTTVGGGQNNQATHRQATVGGGKNNDAICAFATVGGGENNTAGTGGQIDNHPTVAGGYDNDAVKSLATVGGGGSNVASGFASTVGGGQANAATGAKTVVMGGDHNIASGDFSTVDGGQWNQATGSHSIVLGGKTQIATQPNMAYAMGIKLLGYTTTEMNALPSPEAGTVIYNSTANVLYFYNGAVWGAV